MQIKGKVWKSEGKFWEVECETLQANTAGTSRKDALEMMKDWVRTMLGQPGFDFDIRMAGKDEFTMTFAATKPIVALIVERQRSVSGISYRALAEKLGKKSASSVTSLVSAKHDPGFETLAQIFSKMGLELQISVVAKGDDDVMAAEA